jgi:hypothetical protein
MLMARCAVDGFASAGVVGVHPRSDQCGGNDRKFCRVAGGRNRVKAMARVLSARALCPCALCPCARGPVCSPAGVIEARSRLPPGRLPSSRVAQ